MKVGVLTFHRTSNFGTALQAFATVEALRNLGVDAELIDYRPVYLEKTMTARRLRNAKKPKEMLSIVVNRMIYGGTQEEKIKRFAEFVSGIPTSSEFCTEPEDLVRMAQGYDVLLSGSDQLWNERITGRDLSYFFPFPHKKKISYASSFGVSEISQEREAAIAPLLRDFDSLAVREQTALELVCRLLGGESTSAVRVVDPTLLLDASQWSRQEATDVKLPENGYILTYYMLETPELRAITQRLREKTGLPVVNIKPSKRQQIFQQGTNMVWAGPRELLSCYAGASYVVTNSFHGTAFAINYGVPMYVSPLPFSMAGQVNSRLIEVLQWYGLEDRWITSVEAAAKLEPGALPDQLPEIKTQLREESLCILKTMLA